MKKTVALLTALMLALLLVTGCGGAPQKSHADDFTQVQP